jgi:hypothetical protein
LILLSLDVEFVSGDDPRFDWLSLRSGVPSEVDRLRHISGQFVIPNPEATEIIGCLDVRSARNPIATFDFVTIGTEYRRSLHS